MTFPLKVIACSAASRLDHRAGCTRPPEELRIVQHAIHAERAGCDALSLQATQAGAQAFARLLTLAQAGDSGQIPRIARFLAATYNGRAFAFDLFELRAVDVAIRNDMLCGPDALRWGRADLYTLIPGGDTRGRAVIQRWDLRRPHNA